MPDLLPLDPDQLLTTTRAVRKRLDLSRPVPIEVIRDALSVALQAPSGSNRQRWHWIVVDDPEAKGMIAGYYQRVFAAYEKAMSPAPGSTGERVMSSSRYLSDNLARVPVLVIGALQTDSDTLPEGNQAGLWGSLLPAAWSLTLALRARGLGTSWTSMHLQYEREISDALGIPPNVHQGVLLPVAYTVGTDFHPAKRADADSVLHVNTW